MLFGHEKENILHLPTPIEYLPSVSRDLGLTFYIKRDDLTPLAMGGNKLRKAGIFRERRQGQGGYSPLDCGRRSDQPRQTHLRRRQQVRAQGLCDMCR